MVNTNYMIPSPKLPMLLPFQQIGVPQPIVNGVNSALQRIVNYGCSSLTPDAGPYCWGGILAGAPIAGNALSFLGRALFG